MAPSRAVQKAEAKYNVTSSYFDLQLHSAAANGNVGLVKYALMHGQPVNSVLNGVLPIHVAASAGNEHVVQMLIEAGADVNAPRLPRKYSADKAKAVNSIGVAGSTPLHFAAANGHANVTSLLLSHGANPGLQEKHGFTAEDVARQFDQVNVLTVLQLWRDTRQRELEEELARQGGTVASTSIGPGRLSRSDIDNASLSPSLRSFPGITSPLRSPLKFGKSSGSDAASIKSTSTARRLLGKPSMESLTTFGSKGKSKLAKALQTAAHGSTPTNNSSAAGVNVIRTFPAPPPLSLRQNPIGTSNIHSVSGTAPRHHLVSMEKASKSPLPAVFERATQQSFPNIRATLGMTPSSSSLSINRSLGGSSIKDLNDPYRFTRAKPSSSRTSLSSVFRSSSSRDRGSESISQPLSPAASSFFTEDYELERAERDAFLRADSREQRSDRDVSSGDETYMQLRLPPGHYHSTAHARDASGEALPANAIRRPSIDVGATGRSRAGSSSSAATTGSGRSYAYPYPLTAPPTQTSFFQNQTDMSTSPEGPPLSAYPSTAFGSSTLSSSVTIPVPIPAPPSSSTQPFFSKAAISAAHSNSAIARPGFYRPRKSSALSNSASNASDAERESYQMPEIPDFRLPNRQSLDTAGSERLASNPAVVIRRPTVTDIDTREVDTIASRTRDYAQKYSHIQAANPDVTDPRAADVPLPDNEGRAVQANNAPADAELAREQEDTFPSSSEPIFLTRSRAGSRARADSIASVLNASASATTPVNALLGAKTAGVTSNLLHQTASDQEGGTAASARAYRSGSVSTDARTSRSGSIGEGYGPSSRYIGYDYSSSSPAASVASLAYQTSHSTVATSVVSSPPGTGFSQTASSSTAVSDAGSRSVTYAEAQSMVKEREMQLLSFDTSQDIEQSGFDRQQSLSSQLAAYAESLSIERQLSDAEKRRTGAEPPPLLVIPEAPEGPKYSWEILGKEARTLAPITKGQRRRDGVGETEPRQQPVAPQQQRMWTHRMVSPYEASLPRLLATTGSGKSALSAPPITSGGRVFPLSPTIPEDVDPGRDGSPAEASTPVVLPKERPLRNKTSTLSSTGSHLAVPGGSDVSSIRLPRRKPSASPAGKSPRASQEKDRQPSTKYHIVAGPGSEPTDSANSSLVSEPKSHMHLQDSSSNLSIPRSIRHSHTRSDPPLMKVPSRSPEVIVTSDDTPRQPSILQSVVAPKYHNEPKAGGESAPSPTRAKLSSKIGKMFK